jgi:hypothetical protein
MTSIEFYERDTVINRIEDNFNQISEKYFEGSYGIASITDNGDYLTVRGHSLFVGDSDTQKLFDVLENYSQKEYDSCYEIWDCLDNCKYTLPDQETDNELKTDELSFSEKRQVALVDWLLSQPDLEYQEFDKAENLERENFKLTQSIKEGYEIINHLTICITQLHTRIYQLEQENKRLKSSQLEAKPEPIVISYQ